ncbi:hypothetical protein, partial [Persephonella sp.]
LQEERSGMAELKKKSIGIVKGLTIGTVVRNPTLAQAIDIATSVVLARGLDRTMYKDTAAVIPIYENPNLVSKDCKFQPVLKFRNEKQKEHWNRKFQVMLSFPHLFMGYDLHGIEMAKENYPSKIKIYFVKFDNPRLIPIFREAYPFIHALVDIIIEDELAGRYVIYGNAGKALARWENGDMKSIYFHIKDHCLKFRPDLQKQAKNSGK